MALETGGLDGKSLKRAEAYNRALKSSEKSLKAQQKLAGGISDALLGVDGSEFFRSLTSGEQAAKLGELGSIADDLNTKAQSAGEELDSTFQKIGESSGMVNKSVDELAGELGVTDEIAAKLLKSFKDTDGSAQGISSILQEMGESGEELYKTIVEDLDLEENLVNQFKDSVEELKELDTELLITKKSMEDVDKTVADIGAGMAAVGANMTKSFNMKSLIGGLMEFDATIKQAQIDTGINFSQNTTDMAMLTSETAKFGMSVKDTTDMMGALGAELRTSNFEVLKEATQDLAAMQKATGLSAENVGKLGKEFMMFGQSSKDVAEYSGEVMAEAEAFGLNGREIMEDIAKNMGNMRRMGFIGGEQSLKRMVMEAKRLGMDVDEIFNVAKKARSIEGAMEMAAELQLAGGSFAAIDPMQLLSAARKGPEELTKILGSMGSDIGSWVTDIDGNKKYQFDPVDADRLQMVSDATGMELDSLQNMIAKNAEDASKLELLPPGLFGADLSDEEKSFLMNATKIGENGALELNAGIDGIDDLSNLTQENIQAGIADGIEEKKRLEEQAKENMGFQESKDALMASITNLFSVFQPVLQMLTNVLQSINEMGPVMKGIVGGGILAAKLLYGPAKSYLQGLQIGKGFNVATSGGGGGGFMSKVKGFFGKGGKPGGDGTGDIAKTASKAGKTDGAAKGTGAGLKGLAKGLRAMGGKGILKGILAMALLGPAMIVFLPAIPGLFAIALLGLMAAPLALGFGALRTGYSMMGSALTEIAKGSLAMALIGLSILPFAFAAQIMSGVDWLNVLAGVGVMFLVVLGLTALGLLMVFAWPLLLFGVGGLLVAAGGMYLAGMLLAAAIEPLQAIADADWSALLPFAAVIGSFGFSMVFGAIGLLAGAVALYLAAPMLAASVEPLAKVAGTDWSGLISFGEALKAVGPGMLAFAFAGLLMFNPLMLLGLVTMMSAVYTLGQIMSTLGPNLETGADGIERMADGIGKLESAVANMNLEKLSKLQGIASTIASGGANIGKFADAMNGGGGSGGSGGGGGTVRHIVVLELDGKKLKEIELRDNKYSS